MDGYVRPVLTRTQLPPPPVVLNTPKAVPAYTVAGAKGSIARVTAEDVRPVLVRVQFTPQLTLLNTPAPIVPAYTVAGVAGSIARTLTFRFVRPLLTAVQLPPPLTLLNTPPAAVPAYTVAGVTGSTARALTMPSSGPLLVQTLTPAEATPPARPREATTTRVIKRAFESDSIGNSFLISVASGHGGCSRNRPNFAQSKKLKQSPRDACFVRLQGKRLSLVKLLVESSKRGQGARPVVYLLVGSGRPAAQCATFMKVYRSP